jgi:hypothetical protein
MRYYVGRLAELELRFYQGPAGFSRRRHSATSLLTWGLQTRQVCRAYMSRWGHGHPGRQHLALKKQLLAESIAAGETEGFNDTMKVAGGRDIGGDWMRRPPHHTLNCSVTTTTEIQSKAAGRRSPTGMVGSGDSAVVIDNAGACPLWLSQPAAAAAAEEGGPADAMGTAGESTHPQSHRRQ